VLFVLWLLLGRSCVVRVVCLVRVVCSCAVRFFIVVSVDGVPREGSVVRGVMLFV